MYYFGINIFLIINNLGQFMPKLKLDILTFVLLKKTEDNSRSDQCSSDLIGDLIGMLKLFSSLFLTSMLINVQRLFFTDRTQA